LILNSSALLQFDQRQLKQPGASSGSYRIIPAVAQLDFLYRVDLSALPLSRKFTLNLFMFHIFMGCGCFSLGLKTIGVMFYCFSSWPRWNKRGFSCIHWKSVDVPVVLQCFNLCVWLISCDCSSTDAVRLLCWLNLHERVWMLRLQLLLHCILQSADSTGCSGHKIWSSLAGEQEIKRREHLTNQKGSAPPPRSTESSNKNPNLQPNGQTYIFWFQPRPWQTVR